jgi:hypothetical protein
LIPTVLSLQEVKLDPTAILVGVLLSLLVGLPIFGYGNIAGIALWKTVGSLTTVLLSGIIALLGTKLKEVRT